MANRPVDDWQDVGPNAGDDWQDVSSGGLSPADVRSLTVRTGPSESRSQHAQPKPGFWQELNQQIGPAAWYNTYQQFKQAPLRTLGGMVGRAASMVGGIEPVPGQDIRHPSVWGDPTAASVQDAYKRGPAAVAAGVTAGLVGAGLGKLTGEVAEPAAQVASKVPVGRVARAAGAAAEKFADKVPVVGGVIPAARAMRKAWQASAPEVEEAEEAAPKPSAPAGRAPKSPPVLQPRPEDLSTTGPPQTLSPGAPATTRRPSPGAPPPPPSGYQLGVPASQIPAGFGLGEGSSLSPPPSAPRPTPGVQPPGSVPLKPPPSQIPPGFGVAAGDSLNPPAGVAQPAPGPQPPGSLPLEPPPSPNVPGFGLASGDSTQPPAPANPGAPPPTPPIGSTPLQAPPAASMPPGFGVASGDSLNAPASSPRPASAPASPPPSMTPLGELPKPKANAPQSAPATPAPAPTAAAPTVPESAETIQTQLDQLASGDRRAVMLPKGTPPPAARPTGTRAFRDVHGNIYIYDPKTISTEEIRTAAAQNKLPEVLGATKGGLGAPDKSQLSSPPTAVVSRTPAGAEVQATATDSQHLPTTVAQTAKVTPPGGSVSVEPPEQVLSERATEYEPGEGEEASVKGPRGEAALDERPNWQAHPTGAKVAEAQPGSRFQPPDHLVWRGEGQAPYEGRPLIVEQVNRKTGAVSARVPGRPDLSPVKLSKRQLASWEIRPTPIFRNEARALAANGGLSLDEAAEQLSQTHGRQVSDHPLGRLPGEGSYLREMGYKLQEKKPPAPASPATPASAPPSPPSSLPSTMTSADVDQWIRESGLSPSQAIFELVKAGVKITDSHGKPIF